MTYLMNSRSFGKKETAEAAAAAAPSLFVSGLFDPPIMCGNPYRSFRVRLTDLLGFAESIRDGSTPAMMIMVVMVF